MIELSKINLREAIENNIDRTKWVNWKFSDLVDNIVEKVVPKDSGLEHYIGLEHLDSGSLKIRRFGETSTLIGDKLKIYKGDLIFAKRNAYLKRIAIAEFDAVASAHSMVLRPKSKNVNPDFLPFFLMSELFWKRAIEISVGSLSPTINWKVLAKQEFLLPPKDQQARLARLLWALDEVMEREREVLEGLERALRSSIRYHFRKANRVVRVKDLGSIITGATPSTSNSKYWKDGIIPFVTPSEINDSIYVNKTERFLTKEGALKSRMLAPKSVLTVCIGSTIGKVAINQIESCSNQQINAIIPYDDYSPTYILHLLRYHKSKILARTGATAVPIINKTEFESIKLPIINKKEIRLFEKDVNCFTQCLKFIESKILTSKALQKSLINQIF